MKDKEQIKLLETQISHLKGRLEALSSVCAILVATHPKGSDIVRVYTQRTDEMRESEQPTEYLREYVGGFGSLEVNLDEILALFERDELKLSSKPPH